jgi:hypothetical protein
VASSDIAKAAPSTLNAGPPLPCEEASVFQIARSDVALASGQHYVDHVRCERLALSHHSEVQPFAPTRAALYPTVHS